MQIRKIPRHGFTLIELLVVIAVFGILSLAAVPYFESIISSSDLKTASNTVIYSLNKAKRIASAENTFVDLELENNSILLSTQSSGKKESLTIPGNITFANKINITFNANGIIVSEEGNSIESNTNILIKHKSLETKQETISVSTTGFVAAM